MAIPITYDLPSDWESAGLLLIIAVAYTSLVLASLAFLRALARKTEKMLDYPTH